MLVTVIHNFFSSTNFANLSSTRVFHITISSSSSDTSNLNERRFANANKPDSRDVQSNPSRVSSKTSSEHSIFPKLSIPRVMYSMVSELPE